ncbi:hypothetical protein BDY21DRAFT_190450 [Lineolata rhizophorae]|uniref:Uncharacterized protein n=1 Tax=Lineolata rhizophorae TaxID=578093 RepID=A0A6A6P5Z8_9PEZI|nr:hypothetical protein BDY21DRAFT_190450 [Lineolata rhizophorae]
MYCVPSVEHAKGNVRPYVVVAKALHRSDPPSVIASEAVAFVALRQLRPSSLDSALSPPPSSSTYIVRFGRETWLGPSDPVLGKAIGASGEAAGPLPACSSVKVAAARRNQRDPSAGLQQAHPSPGSSRRLQDGVPAGRACDGDFATEYPETPVSTRRRRCSSRGYRGAWEGEAPSELTMRASSLARISTRDLRSDVCGRLVEEARAEATDEERDSPGAQQASHCAPSLWSPPGFPGLSSQTRSNTGSLFFPCLFLSRLHRDTECRHLTIPCYPARRIPGPVCSGHLG